MDKVQYLARFADGTKMFAEFKTTGSVLGDVIHMRDRIAKKKLQIEGTSVQKVGGKRK